MLQNSTLSKELPVEDSLPVGSSVVIEAGSTGAFPSSVAVVTSLGNVFASSPSVAPSSGGTWKVLEAGVGGPGVDMQVYQNPSDPTRYYLSQGPSAFGFSALTGAQLWSFDAGQGEVTDVLPLSDGTAYVSDGYFGDQFTSNLFRLTRRQGPLVATYSMRLLRLYTTIEVQFPNNGQPPYPVGSQPVQKATGGLYAYYDGWFLSSSGPAPTTVPADTFNLAGSDASQFYVYASSANPGGFGCTEPDGQRGDHLRLLGGVAGRREPVVDPRLLQLLQPLPRRPPRLFRGLRRRGGAVLKHVLDPAQLLSAGLTKAPTRSWQSSRPRRGRSSGAGSSTPTDTPASRPTGRTSTSLSPPRTRSRW